MWYFLLLGVRFLPGLSGHDHVFVIIAAVSGVFVSVAMVVMSGDVSGRLELFPDRIALGVRVLTRSYLRGELVTWVQPHLWTKLGTAVRLTSAHGTWLIGGRDHLHSAQAAVFTTQKVNASLSASDFVDFVRALGLVPDPLAAPESTDRLVVDLLPSTTSMRGWWRQMSPWAGTIAISGAIGIASSALGAFETRAGMLVVNSLVVGVVVVGLGLTIRTSLRPPAPRYRLLVEHARVSLCDARHGNAIIDASVSKPTATPRVYRSAGRGPTFEAPCVRLEWPSRSIVVGVWNTSFRWPQHAKKSWALHYIIGSEEWRRLIRALGLG